MAKITLKQLKRLGACEAQVMLFKDTFGESVELTEAIALEYAGEFDVEWISKQLLKALAWAEYDRVKALAWAEYDRVKALALAEYWRIEAVTFVCLYSEQEGI